MRFALFALPALAAATAILPRTGGPSCSTGPIQCCNSAENSQNLSDPTKILLGLLNINISDLTGLVGITCAPIVGSTCSGQALCCQNDNFNGVVVLGCNQIVL